MEQLEIAGDPVPFVDMVTRLLYHSIGHEKRFHEYCKKQNRELEARKESEA